MLTKPEDQGKRRTMTVYFKTCSCGSENSPGHRLCAKCGKDIGHISVSTREEPDVLAHVDEETEAEQHFFEGKPTFGNPIAPANLGSVPPPTTGETSINLLGPQQPRIGQDGKVLPGSATVPPPKNRQTMAMEQIAGAQPENPTKAEAPPTRPFVGEDRAIKKIMVAEVLSQILAPLIDKVNANSGEITRIGTEVAKITFLLSNFNDTLATLVTNKAQKRFTDAMFERLKEIAEDVATIKTAQTDDVIEPLVKLRKLAETIIIAIEQKGNEVGDGVLAELMALRDSLNLPAGEKKMFSSPEKAAGVTQVSAKAEENEPNKLAEKVPADKMAGALQSTSKQVNSNHQENKPLIVEEKDLDEDTMDDFSKSESGNWVLWVLGFVFMTLLSLALMKAGWFADFSLNLDVADWFGQRLSF